MRWNIDNSTELIALSFERKKLKMNRISSVQECDATMLNRITIARFINKNLMKKIIANLLLALFLCPLLHAQIPSPATQQWKDEKGNFINAHGAGILFYNNTYYLFGEIKKGKTHLVPNQSWEDYRVDASGISCYSSKDLVNWKYEGIALAPNKTDSSSDIHISKVIERPKVIYNARTKKFVMWMHIDKEDYSYAHVGVAVSDKPQGPYHFLRSLQPNGQQSRDMTLFKDTNGKAYLIYSSEN